MLYSRRLQHGDWQNRNALSGGERQRIPIARSLLKDASIAFVNEAAASPDSENKVRIQEVISELAKGRTVIVIAHRLKTIMGAYSTIGRFPSRVRIRS